MGKITLVIMGLLFAQVSFAKNEVRLVHPTCKVAIDMNYTNDGLNTFLTQAATQSLSKKGFEVVAMEDAQGGADQVMAIKVDLSTEAVKKRGKCKAVLSLRSAIDDGQTSMLLANIVKKKGSIVKVAGKCVKGVIKAIKAYPKCGTVLDPDTQVDEPTPPSDDAPDLPDTDTDIDTDVDVNPDLANN